MTRLQTILDHVDNAIMVLDADLRVESVNERYYAIWGLSREFLQQRPTIREVILEGCRMGLYPEGEVESLIERRMQMLAGGLETFALETPRTDGVSVEGYARRLPEGGYLLTFRDVTAHIRQQEELQRTREHYRLLLEALPHGIVECDRNGRISYVNRQFCELWQADVASLVGKLFVELELPEVVRQLHAGRFLHAAESAALPFSEMVPYLSPAGEVWRQVDWSPAYDQGRLSGFIGVVTDISPQIAYEQTLAHTADSLRNLFDAAPMAVISLSAGGAVIHWNRRAEALLGWSSDFAHGILLADLILPAEQQPGFSSLLARSIAGESLRHELTIVNRNQEQVDISISLSKLGGEGEPEAVVAIIDDIRERKRMEQALRNSEETYRSLIASVPVPIFVHVNGCFVFLNPAAVALFGAATEEELVGAEIVKLLAPSDRPAFQSALDESSQALDETCRYTLRIEPLAGGERVVEATFLGLNYSGCLTRMAICIDVTEQRIMEAALRSSEQKFRAIFDQAFQFSGLLDLDGRMLEVNRASLEFSGVREEDVIGRYFWETRWWDGYPEIQARIRQAVEAVRTGEFVRFETINRGADGVERIIDFSLKPVFNEQGEIIFLIPEGRDITARKKAELALQQSAANYRQLSQEFETIFDGIPDSLTVWSSDQHLLWANRATCDYFGRSLEELRGSACTRLCIYGLCNENDCEIRSCIGSGGTDERMRRSQDGRIWGIKTFLLKNEKGEGVRAIRLASDLTERHQLREEAARAAHLAALGELVAGVAHEINNPTGLILLNLPVVRDAFRDARPILEEHFDCYGDFPFAGLRFSQIYRQIPPMLDELIDGAERIKHIVDELKEFSQPTDPHQLDRIDLCEVVKKAAGLASSQLKKLTRNFTLHCDGNLPPIMGSPRRLEQVMINLILNAGQALPTIDGVVAVTVAFRAERGRNIITVRDTGVGIPPEHLQQVFDPFYTTRREVGGTGLGLSVSSRIIHEHGGSLQIESQPGEGTTVTLEFPCV